MNHTATVSATLSLAILLSLSCSIANAQQEDRVSQLEQRLDQLEQRLARIELLLVDRRTSSVEGAESRLAAAQQRLQYTQRLFAKGYLSRSQLKTDELAVAKARGQLARAQHGRDDPQTEKEIEILEAETKLAVCQDLLRYAELRARNEQELQAWKMRVQQAQEELDRLLKTEPKPTDQRPANPGG